MAAKGRLQGDRVLVADEKEANTLYNKGSFGAPQSGGSLVLDLAEALYLVEQNRLVVQGEDAGSLLAAASAAERDFEIRYVAYRDLRGRTFVVKRATLTDLHVYPRGSLPGRAASTHLVRCASERSALDAAAVLADAQKAGKAGKALLMAVVDEEGDLTYYEVKEVELKADAPALPRAKAEATLLDDRVVVLDRTQRDALFAEGYFGRDIGMALQLSLPEALYLVEAGKLRVRDAQGKEDVSGASLAEAARRLEPDFDARHALYRHLRKRGVVVKTGFKYGAHFRAYTGAPEEEHAPYLVHAVARPIPWPEVAGFVRLAHGVRKRFFFATPDDSGGFRLLELTRKKP